MENNLKIIKRKMLESIFIETINPNKKKLIVGSIYRHPCMKVNDFNNDFFSNLSEKLLKEKSKDFVLMGDFNVELLKYETDTNIKNERKSIEKNCKNFKVEQLINDIYKRLLIEIKTLEINKKQTNASFTKNFDIFELLLDSHTHPKKTPLVLK